MRFLRLTKAGKLQTEIVPLPAQIGQVKVHAACKLEVFDHADSRLQAPNFVLDSWVLFSNFFVFLLLLVYFAEGFGFGLEHGLAANDEIVDFPDVRI